MDFSGITNDGGFQNVNDYPLEEFNQIETAFIWASKLWGNLGIHFYNLW